MLARETQRRPARDEHVEVCDPVEERRHVRGRGRHVLEVVEQENCVRAFDGLGDAVQERRALTYAEHLGDRGGDELGIGHGGKADEVDRALERDERRDLEGQPALTRAARARDRDEPDVRTAQECEGPGQILASPHEAVVQSGQGRPAEGAQRSEPFLQARGDELEQLLGAGDALEPVAPERAEREPAALAHEVPSRP